MLFSFDRPSQRRGLLLLGIYCLTALFGNIAAAQQPAKIPSAPVVPGFVRFHQGADADAVKGGQLLLGELNCISCHAPAKADASLNRKSAPILDHVGARVKRAYLREFLRDPQAVKPGTTMPNVFAELDEADKKANVEALTQFLASTGVPEQIRADHKSVAGGKDLYHKVGCVACHGTRTSKGDQDKTFAGTVPLGNLKAKYTLGSLRDFLESPHKVRPSGRMPGLLNAKEASDIANFLMQGTVSPSVGVNMAYSYYEGEWQKLPDFSKLKPKAVGEATDFELGITRRTNNVALKFDGFLKIDKEGSYNFHVMSDDGSRLWIDGKPIVNNDGVHAPATKSGKAKLTKGMHKLTVAVFNAGGGFELGVEVEGPGLGRRALGPMVHLKETPDPLPVGKKDDPERAPLVAELVAQGKELFVSMGCASCHQLKGIPTQNTSKAPSLAQLKPVAGCLQGTPKKGVPWYNLNAAQQVALRVALRAPAPAKLNAKETVARTLVTFNCYACHDRDKVGGVEQDVNKSFLTAQPEMGDEGRLPPSLTGVGAKLNPVYLRKILDQGSHDRPYMYTRMPKFGDANVGHLVALFDALDPAEPGPKIALPEPLSKFKFAARQLVSSKGGFSCIQCHTFAGNKSQGVQGIDMTLLTQRLKKDWFHNYMINPAKYRPGTRMPSSFPDGQTLLKKVLDGKAETQIEALWVYLADGKAATLPLGLNKTSIPLVPTTEAILYRNFIQGAGPRAIGVGYPEKAHLAFDANDVRLAMIWQGAFMDARRHWTGRGEGFEPPMGDNLLFLPTGAAFAVLSQPEEPWPTTPAKTQGYRFLGYRLSDDQRPTFLYAFKDVKVEDFPNAVETKANPGIRRTLTLTAEQAVDKLYFRAATGDKIEAQGDGWYRIGELRLRIEAGAAPVIRRSGNKMELLVPVQFQNKSAKIVQEFVW